MLLLAGCGAQVNSGRGFRLPAGNPEKGKEAFLALRCDTCHSISGLTLPTSKSAGSFNVVLGGPSLRVRTYGELVTSLVNPSHVLSPEYRAAIEKDARLSPMPQFNHIMTVEQLIDLVAFLQPQYKLPPPNPVIASD